MTSFTKPLSEHEGFSGIVRDIKEKRLPVLAGGLTNTSKCNLIEGLAKETGRQRRVIVTYDEIRAREIVQDMSLYDKETFFYPAKDMMFFAADVHGNAIVNERLEVLKKLSKEEGCTVVLSLEALLLRQLPLRRILERIVVLNVGETINLDHVREKISALGYENVGQVSGKGQFSVRGGILDIFPLAEEVPYRVELWGDEIDTIRSFDVESQRSIENVEGISVYPAAEIVIGERRKAEGIKTIIKEKEEQVKKLRSLMKTEEAFRLHQQVEEFKDNLEIYGGSFGIDSYIGYFFEETVSFLDYFGEDCLFFVDEPKRVEERGRAISFQWRETMSTRLEKGYILPKQADILYDHKEILTALSKRETVLLSMIEHQTEFFLQKASYAMNARSISPYNGSFELLVKDLTKYKKEKYRVILVTASSARAERLLADLTENDLHAVIPETDREPLAGEVIIRRGSLQKGFEYPLIRFAVISETDLFGNKKKKKTKKNKKVDGSSISKFSELHEGDYVIHDSYGVGIYRGIEKITNNYITKDYVKIEYAGGSNLYILATGLDMLQKYGSKEGAKPKINKLGGKEWTNTKNKVKASVHEVAKDLVMLYAKRSEEVGYQFSSDTVWQQEFEEMFPYEETDDQLSAITDVKRDMESPKIMDRLICGDVGFGKTEIAIRAAFKAVSDGKQVAVLVPTTILAGQHYETFKERMKSFPITIDFLSRFKTEKEVKKIKERLANGLLDIVIGTHKLLSKDIKYKNIGLLIIDEEQRFGVGHKEKIKKMRENIDVLTLSATPIPRTLHMSLSGIRDMSVLEEPPAHRLPIQTYVLEHDDELIREAITREIARGGQVYYVYNKIKDIEDVYLRMQKLLPNARISFAHGRMSERELESIMSAFIAGEIEVLISTTIIETGIDISNVNTILIDDADKMGLSQLYQLRGRVGRSTRTSYAFLMYKKDRMLKEVAEKRLAAIKEFTDLGSGFKISMRDLEIRGAGNLLGKVQSGHIETVGYELYCKLLNEAVRSLKGEGSFEYDFETKVDISVNAHIPAAYIKNEVQRLEMYKRIACVTSEEDVLDLKDELIDRYGELPETVDSLIDISYIRYLAHEAFCTNLLLANNEVKLFMNEKARLHTKNLPGFMESYEGKLSLKCGKPNVFRYALPVPKNNKEKALPSTGMLTYIKEFLLHFVEELVRALPEKKGEHE